MSEVVIFRAKGDSLERLDVQAATLDEATLRTAHGVYTVFRLYPGKKVVRLASHFARLRESARLLGEPFSLADDWLRSMLRQAVEAAGIDLPRVRLTVPFDAPDGALISLEPFSPPPPELYTRGVRVGLAEGQRDSAQAKNSRFIEWRRQVWANQPADVYEIILHDDQGFLREGTSSNFYGVLDDALRTAGEGVLAGISRSILLEVAPEVLPVAYGPIHLDDLPRL